MAGHRPHAVHNEPDAFPVQSFQVVVAAHNGDAQYLGIPHEALVNNARNLEFFHPPDDVDAHSGVSPVAQDDNPTARIGGRFGSLCPLQIQPDVFPGHHAGGEENLLAKVVLGQQL